MHTLLHLCFIIQDDESLSLILDERFKQGFFLSFWLSLVSPSIVPRVYPWRGYDSKLNQRNLPYISSIPRICNYCHHILVSQRRILSFRVFVVKLVSPHLPFGVSLNGRAVLIRAHLLFYDFIIAQLP